MDLASFIPGIGPTTSFTPGSNTPPPFNVPHTGLTDGTGPATASKNMAEVYNRILLELKATVVYSGLAIDNTNWTQLYPAIKRIADASAAAAVSTLPVTPTVAPKSFMQITNLTTGGAITPGVIANVPFSSGVQSSSGNVVSFSPAFGLTGTGLRVSKSGSYQINASVTITNMQSGYNNVILFLYGFNNQVGEVEFIRSATTLLQGDPGYPSTVTINTVWPLTAGDKVYCKMHVVNAAGYVLNSAVTSWMYVVEL